MLIAQITDTHITRERKPAYNRVDTAAYLERAVAHVNALDPRPDIVVMTGDLVDEGTPGEYAILRDILAPLAMPFYLMPGNHDARGALRSGFPDHAYLGQSEDWIQYAIEEYPLRLLALDTVTPGRGHGELCEGRLGWLAERLAEQPERPTLVMLHHPPFPTGIAHMDNIGLLQGADGLGRIVAGHRQVQRLLCGHLHRPIQAVWHGTPVSVAPSPAHQVAMDLRPGGPSAFVMEPPAIHLHSWTPAGLVTHQSYIGEFDGPYLFRDGSPAA